MRYVFGLLAALLLSVTGYAQENRQVNGCVLDVDDTPLPEAAVASLNDTKGVKTGADGRFSMTVSVRDKYVIVTKDGYFSQTQEIDGSFMVFRLKRNKKYFEELKRFEEAAAKARAEERVRVAAAKAEMARMEAVSGVGYGGEPAAKTVTDSGAPRQYALGDIYDNGGVRGVVIQVSDGGLHGTVMSLDEVVLEWSSLPNELQTATGASDWYDGSVNMRSIEKYIADNGMSWDDFPIFKWCRSKGEGWYIPALNEWYVMSIVYNRTTNRELCKRIDHAIAAAGGEALNVARFYHSSTESASNHRYSHYSIIDRSVAESMGEKRKNARLPVRAFCKF